MSKAAEASQSAPPGYPEEPPPGYTAYPQGHGAIQGQQPPAYPKAGGPPPPPPGYIPPGTTVVVTQPGTNTVMAAVSAATTFRETPITMDCPHCQTRMTTVLHYKAGTLSWISCGSICAVGLALPLLWLGCCFIPFCVKALKDVIHECPDCGMEVGRFDRTRN